MSTDDSINLPPDLPADLLLEIEAINAIYGPDTLTPHSSPSSTGTSPSPSILLLLTPPESHPLHPISLLISFPPTYPSSPPTIEGTHSVGASLPKGTGTHALQISREILAQTWRDGEVAIYSWLTELETALPDALPTSSSDNHHQQSDHPQPGPSASTPSTTADDNHPSNTSTIDDLSGSQWALPTAPNPDANNNTASQPTSTSTSPSTFQPQWTISDPISEKKSLFVAYACPVSSSADVAAATAALLEDKKIARATHNIRAWRLRSTVPVPDNSKSGRQQGHGVGGATGSGGSGGGGSGGGSGTARDKDKGGDRDGNREGGAAAAASRELVVQDRDSDGETAAGGRVLGLMQTMGVWGVLVVVSRWYGGVKLGPDRFRIVAALAREVLVKGGWVAGQGQGQVEGDGEREGAKGGKGGGLRTGGR